MSDNFNLFAELTKKPRPHITVPYPVNKDEAEDIQITLVVLNNHEILEAKEAALIEYEKKKGGENKNILFDDLQTVELLYRSCRNPYNIDVKFFPRKQDVGTRPNDELAVLIEHYNTLVRTRGPIRVNMTDKEMDALIEKIATSALDGGFFLSSLPSEERNALLVYTAKVYYGLLMDNGSRGKQQENT